MTAKIDMADQAARMIGAMLRRLHRETGFPMDCILAGAHAEVVAMMAASFGGSMTALCCEQAAERVRGLPPLGDTGDTLAFAEPAGRA